MRLHRRRRRSLHDLDVGHAHYPPFAHQEAEALDRGILNRVLRDAIAGEERLREEHAQLRHRFREEDHNFADLLRNNGVPVSMAANPRHRDMYQLANRVPDTAIARFNDPAIAMDAIRNDLRRRLQAHITRNHPVERISSWEYSFDIARDALNGETRVVCTARRERIV